MGRKVTLPQIPKRIVSLVPSQTEFLIDIGAPVVGRTKFCIHPQLSVQDIPIIGGTKNFQFEKIKTLKPDLIIGNKEENYQEGIICLENDFPVWMSDIYTLEDAFKMMKAVGSLCHLEENAGTIITNCKASIEKVKGTKKGSVLYLIWQKPWMAAGNGTFIDHMLTHLGFENVVLTDRYPELSDNEITQLNPDYILFSSEPFPFKDKHVLSAKSRWPQSTSAIVDGELYSWYGSRLRYWA